MPIDRTPLPLGTPTTVYNVAYDTATRSKINNIASSAADLTQIVGAIGPNYIVLEDQKVNLNGGSSIVGWQTRILNTKVIDTGSVCTLNGSNQFILLSGTYRIRASAPCHEGNQHQIRLRNITL